jgi:hypothetical protein
MKLEKPGRRILPLQRSQLAFQLPQRKGTFIFGMTKSV